MVFTKQLRAGVRKGDITSSIRIWMHPHVKVGGRYPMEEGEIEIESIKCIDFGEITHELVRESGFPDLDTLLKIAKHGKGQNIYLVRFHYLPPRTQRRGRATTSLRSPVAADDSRGGIDSGTPRKRRSKNH
jgi:hypothetical protein